MEVDLKENYFIGNFNNYYLQYENTPYCFLNFENLSNNITFTKDVKINTYSYISYKYIPVSVDSTCNSLFGMNNSGVKIHIANGVSCTGSEFGFHPNLVLEKFKTYSVELHHSVKSVHVSTDSWTL